MTLTQLRNKFDNILKGLNGNATVDFCSAVENAYEAYIMAIAIKEYARLLGGVTGIVHPSEPGFLNQKPGKFRTNRSFKVTFHSGQTLYFATDIEIHGLPAMEANRPIGIKFEADVVIMHEYHIRDVETNYHGYPAPQHLLGVYECKFGSYNKGQLRELLGLRRHVSVLRNRNASANPNQPNDPHRRAVLNAAPPIQVTMARPKNHSFFDSDTQLLFDLHQIVVN